VNDNAKDHSIVNDVRVQGESHVDQEHENLVNENEQPLDYVSSSNFEVIPATQNPKTYPLGPVLQIVVQKDIEKNSESPLQIYESRYNKF